MLAAAVVVVAAVAVASFSYFFLSGLLAVGQEH